MSIKYFHQYFGPKKVINAGQYSLLELAKDRRHHTRRGFINPWLSQEAPVLREIIKWKISHVRERQRSIVPVYRPDPELLGSHKGPLVSFLGHGTVWLRLEGKNILFDPIFENIAGVVKRLTPPPISPERLPPPDLVLISHAHRDHLSRRALARLRGDPKIIVPLGTSRYFWGKNNILELDWFDEQIIHGVRIIALPVQHWSKRGLLDTNLALWCGYLVEVPGFKLFFGGDTGYYFGFREIGAHFGPFDLALLPCGAFLPRWLMAPFHMNPQEAVLVAQELGARWTLPIHWGAYRLGDESIDAPPRLFKREALKRQVKPLILYPGEIAVLSGEKIIYL